jgi:site-specific DNA-methyltransferase (adenine-specific)
LPGDFINRVLVGDCRSILPSLPEGFFDSVITSPPYWKLRDYGHPDQIGREKTSGEYLETLSGVFRLVNRVLKPEGSLWINIADQYHNKELMGLPWRLILKLKEDGWILRNTLIWHKTNPIPASVKNRLNQDYEYLFHLVRSPDYYYNLDAVRIPHKTAELFRKRQSIKRSREKPEKNDSMLRRFRHNPCRQPGHPQSKAFHPLGKNPGCVITLPAKRSGEKHPATFPGELCRIPILATCPPEGIILDPFAGTGSALMMAKKLGRKFTGIELNGEYTDADGV